MSAMLQRNSFRTSLEAKFIICRLFLPLEQPKSPAAPRLSSTVLCPSTAEGPAISICPLRVAAALPVCLCPGTAGPGTTWHKDRGDAQARGMQMQHAGHCSDLVFRTLPHQRNKKITKVFSERDLLSLTPWTQAQLAHQLGIEVREKVHEAAGEDQMGQSSVSVLQMQCQDTGMS